jgi:pilus assembly protein CpaB
MIVLPDDYDVVIGKRMLMPLKRNEMLTWTHVDIPERGRLGLSSMIQHDRRAISIGVSGPNAVSGLVLPNDHVDILGTFALPSRQAAGETEVVTLTLLQDVTVLATGTRLGKQLMYGGDQWSSGAGGYSAVSLEVTPREAEVLVFAQQMKGQLTLSLRNRDDVGFVRELPEVDFKRLESELPNLNDYRQREIWKKKEL